MNNNIDKVIKKTVCDAVDVAYPVSIIGYEIRKIVDINKLYAVLSIQKYTNDVTTVKIKYQTTSAFGEILQESEQLVKNVDSKSIVFTANLPIHNDTDKIEACIQECLLQDGTIVANKQALTLTEKSTKIESREEIAIASKYVSKATVYAKDLGDFWYCGCGALNLKDNANCVACNVSKEVSLEYTSNQKLAELLEKEKELKEQQKEKAYDTAIKKLATVKTLKDYKELKAEFEGFKGYKGSKLYIEKCNKQIEVVQKKQNKRNIIISVASFVFVGVVVILCLLPSIIENNKYKKIAQFLADGDLNSAYAIMYEIDDYDQYKLPSSNITEVVVADGVTTIKAETFMGFSNLTSVTIPDSVTSIGESAFEGCSSLTSVVIGNSVISIGGSAFSGCYDLTIREIPDSVTSIGGYAFRDCSSLTSIEIPNSVTSIGNGAFEDCWRLTSIVIPNSVTSIGERAFFGCPINTAAIPTVAISSVAKSELKNVTINGGTSIGYRAFYHCSSLTSIEIPDSVTSIGESAFEYCSSLTSIVIPNSVTSIGERAFFGCQINTAAIPTVAISSVANSKLKTVVINGGTSIGSSVFKGCRSLTSVTIPDSVTSIGEYAFSGCSSLTGIEIPNSITSIGEYAFSGCSSLTGIEIPNSVTSMGESAFYDCRSLTSITIPFVGAKKDGTSNTHFGYIFGASSYSSNASYVPKALKTVKITGGTSIGGFAFKDCSSLTSVTIPDSVTSIESYAFTGCGNLTSITIPNSVTSIGNGIFDECAKLANITMSDKVTRLGSYVFDDTAYYKNKNNWVGGVLYIGNCLIKVENAGFDFSIKEGTKVIAPSALARTGIKSITIPDSVVSIGEEAFSSADFTSITIPKNVKYIGAGVFNHCSNLKEIKIDSSNSVYKSVDNVLYTKDGKKLIAYAPAKTDTTFVVPNGVEEICEEAFYSHDNLEGVGLPDSVISIGDYAFGYCKKLKVVILSNTLKEIGLGAFKDCTSISKIVIPSSVTYVDGFAFSGWGYSQSVCFRASNASGEWSSLWDDDCNAKITWGYTGE